MEHKDTTEERILTAAQVIFTKKGLAGARMQEIADEAGINKALLHYYFRSKEKLFRKVFERAIHILLSQVGNVLDANQPFFEKIHDLIDLYIDMLVANPGLPLFVLSEINQNPEFLEKQFVKTLHSKLPRLVSQINDEIAKETIKPINPVQLFLNILSMIVFPFAARPLLERVFQSSFNTTFEDLMKDRKKEIYEFIINSIKNN